MGLTREELVDYATRYVKPEEVKPFPHDGEIFAFLHRAVDPLKAQGDGEGWKFGGYAVCMGYSLDVEAKPAGKWVFMEIISLAEFPPRYGSLKLQPPHVALCRFQNPDRTVETRLVSLAELAAQSLSESPPADGEERLPSEDRAGTVLQFRSRPQDSATE